MNISSAVNWSMVFYACAVIPPMLSTYWHSVVREDNAHTGAVKFIQRFGSALNLNVHLHMLFLDGTTPVLFEPLDFISKLAALFLKPRVNLTRYHGAFAPNSKYRALVTPGRRGKGRKIKASDDTQDKSSEKNRATINWAQRLKLIFDIRSRDM